MNRQKIKFHLDNSVNFTANTENSTFLQDLVAGKKLFIQLFTASNFDDYVRGLIEFLDARNVKVLDVSRTNLQITTSHGKILFCTAFNRHYFEKGRWDFVEVLFWTDIPT